jgi:uncharacterized membrane protein
MNSKKVGVTLIVLSAVLLGIFVFSSQNLTTESDELGCFNNEECKPVQSAMSITHFGFGFFGFILALGVYLLVFAKGEQAILSILKKEKEQLSVHEKFAILLMGLDDFEKNVMEEIRKQDGITQNTLKLRVDMSKAKLSHVLTELERKKLIRRHPHKKTLAIFSRLDF